MFRIRSRLLPLLALALLAACGSGARKRPVVLRIFPPDGDVTNGPLQEIQFFYDEPVTVLNDNDIQVLVNGVLFPTVYEINPDNPSCLNVRPAFGYYPTEASLVGRVIQGAVINRRQHYAEDLYQSIFRTGSEASIPVGSPGRVSLLNPEDYSLLGSIATPVGRDPIGLVSTILGQQRRVWVQLDNGALGGDAMAWVDPTGGVPMTVVTLTATGELQSTQPAITVSHSGQKVYVAYRDEVAGIGTVRLSRVDTRSGLEDFSLALASVPATPATMPLGIAVNQEEDRLAVASADGATGTLTYVALSPPFAEIDADPGTPGVQGVTLTAGAGPTAAANGLGLVCPAANADLTRIAIGTGALMDFPSAALGGMTTDIKPSDSRLTMIQSLGAYVGTVGLLWRRFDEDSYATDVTLGVSDNVAGASTGATDALSIAWYGATSQFVALLTSPGGPLMTRWTVDEPDMIEQDDLDLGTAGIQAADISAVVPGATVVGQTFGVYAD